MKLLYVLHVCRASCQISGANLLSCALIEHGVFFDDEARTILLDARTEVIKEMSAETFRMFHEIQWLKEDNGSIFDGGIKIKVAA